MKVKTTLLIFLGSILAVQSAPPLELHTRSRIRSPQDSNQWQVVERTVHWAPAQTAVVVCDMWQRHWCKGATKRVAELAPRMNQLLLQARAQGVLIIHCPSGGMDSYAGTPPRRLAQAAPKIELKVPLQDWVGLDRAVEGPLPIDDSDGGCDCTPQCSQDPQTVKAVMDLHETSAIEIREGDAITDSTEALYLMRERGITNVIVMGVHLNMCVLGRPFAIRQMVRQAQNVLLVRDLTDTMYNSRRRPFVPTASATTS